MEKCNEGKTGFNWGVQLSGRPEGEVGDIQFLQREHAKENTVMIDIHVNKLSVLLLIKKLRFPHKNSLTLLDCIAHECKTKRNQQF